MKKLLLMVLVALTTSSALAHWTSKYPEGFQSCCESGCCNRTCPEKRTCCNN